MGRVRTLNRTEEERKERWKRGEGEGGRWRRGEQEEREACPSHVAALLNIVYIR